MHPTRADGRQRMVSSSCGAAKPLITPFLTVAVVASVAYVTE